MCVKCKELQAQGLPNLDHHVEKGIDYRAAEMKARIERKKRRKVKIPVFYADNDTRRKRLISIREQMDLTQREMAAMMGLNAVYYQRVEHGYPNAKTTMSHLKLAERFFHAFREKRRYNREKEVTRINANLALVGESPIEVQQTPEPVDVPDNPKLHAQFILMYIRGTSPDEIARQLALRPEVIQRWISETSIDTSAE